MTAARKLSSDFQNRLLFANEQPAFDLAHGLHLLGWSNLPVDAVRPIENDIRAFLEELVNQVSSTDPLVSRRRRKIRFWIDAYLRGDCSLYWLVDMLDRVAPSK